MHLNTSIHTEKRTSNDENNGVKVFSMIVAAGKGSRFGATVPKQYTQVLGKTILELSVEALAASQYIKDLFLVISQDDQLATQLNFPIPINFVIGGAERWQSVQAGVQAILDAGADDHDLILIHDAARPCVLVSHIDQVINVAAKQQYGAILGVPVADTLKKVLADNTIEETMDRSSLWRAQTPQVFRAGALSRVLRYIADTGKIITDEASAFEMMGYPVQMVEGNTQNLKLTYAEDLLLMKAIISSQNDSSVRDESEL